MAHEEVPRRDPVKPPVDIVEPVTVRPTEPLCITMKLPLTVADPVNGKVAPPAFSAYEAVTALEELREYDELTTKDAVEENEDESALAA